MGNQENKIILLDPTRSTEKQPNHKELQAQYKIVTYYTFKELMEKQNMKELSKIVVREVNEVNQKEKDQIIEEQSPRKRGQSNAGDQSFRDKEIQQSSLIHKKSGIGLMEEQSPLKNDTSRMQKQGELNYFSKVCSINKVSKKKAFEELISYKRNYSLNIGIYLLVDDITNFLIPENQKPYINMISSKFKEIIAEIQSERKVKFKSDIKFDRLSTNMYRRIMVKIVHPECGIVKDTKLSKVLEKGGEEQIKKLSEIQQIIWKDHNQLKEHGVSYDYYKNIKEFQASSISTNSQYVICRPDYLDEMLDSRKQSGSNFDIIVKPDPDQKELKVVSNNKKYVWARETDIKQIIKIMKRCSNLVSEEKPQPARNTIVCGNSYMFEKNIDQIRRRSIEHLTKTNPKGEKFVQSLNIKFISGGNFFKIQELLKKNVYTLMIVFEEDQFLQTLKGRLRASKWCHRIQLTSLGNFKKDSSDFEEYIQWKLKQLQKVKYKIRFQIAPIPSIHYYVHDTSVQNYRSEIEVVKNRLGIQVYFFREIDLQKFQPPCFEEFFQSGYIICSIAHLPIIKNKLLSFKQHYLIKLKIIVFDHKEAIKKFIKIQDNYKKYGAHICFMHYHVSKITDFLAVSRSPIVSLPFFKKKALSNFQQCASKLQTIKPTLLVLNTELVTTNNVLKGIFRGQFQISISYCLDLLIFTNTEKNVRFFEERYLDAYANLWSVGYSVYGKVTSKTGKRTRMNINVLKQDIKYCFKICKTYDLLKVNDQDFPIFYINKIDFCTSFHDLQLTCLYILSLPHGLNATLSELFRSPRKSKLAIKIFCAYIFVILTTFCKFQDEELGFLRLATYIKDKKDVNRLKTLKAGDIVFTGAFQFCCVNDEAKIEQHKDCIIYEFQKMHFLDKTRVKSHLKIENISFYKEGTEYLIPPYAKFKIKENKINEFGNRHLILEELKDFVDLERSSFTKMVLNSNQIHQNILAKVLQEEILFPEINQDFLDKLEEQNQRQKSLYKRNQLINFEQSKMKHLENLQQGILYNKYFEEFQKKHFVSARDALNEKVQSLTKEAKNQMCALRNQQAINYLNIEFGLLHYKMNEYNSALTCLWKAENFLSSQKQRSSDTWALKKVNSFVKEVQEVIEHRRQFIKEIPKKKKWVIRGVQDQEKNISFAINGKTKFWEANFDPENQSYELRPKQNENSLPSKSYYASEPIHELGSPVLNWYQNNLYQIKSMGSNWNDSDIKSTDLGIYSLVDKIISPQIKSIKQIEEINRRRGLGKERKSGQLARNSKLQIKIPETLAIKKQNFPSQDDFDIEGEMKAGFERKQWQAFYLGPDVKITSMKKKHFHKKLKKID